MKKMIFLSLVSMITLSTFAFKIPPAPSPVTLMNDYIHLLTPQQDQVLEQHLVAFSQKTSIRITVVILDDLNGEEVSVVAPELGHQWGVGQRELNNGIVFLIVKYNQNALEKLFTKKHGDWYIATGYGLEPYLTDADCKSIGESHFIPHAKQDEYYEGILSTVNAMINQLGEVGWQQRKELEEKKRMEYQQAFESFKTGAVYVLLFLLFAAVVIFVVVKIRKALRVIVERREQRKHFSSLFEEQKKKYSSYCSFDFEKNALPNWALEKKEFILSQVSSLRNYNDPMIEQFVSLLEKDITHSRNVFKVFTKNVYLFGKLINQFNDLLEEEKQYQIDAKQKASSVKSQQDEFVALLKDYQQQGYLFPSVISLSEELISFGTLKAVATDYRQVCTTSDTLLVKIRKNKQYVQSIVDLHINNISALESLHKDLTVCSSLIDSAQKTLNDLKASYHEDNWSDVEKAFTSVNSLLKEANDFYKESLQWNDIKVQKFAGAEAQIVQAQKLCTMIKQHCTSVETRKNDIITVKKSYSSITTFLNKKILQVQPNIMNSDVQSDSKLQFAIAQEKNSLVANLCTQGKWILVYALLKEIDSLVDQSSISASNDIASAEQERERLRKKKEEKKEEKNSCLINSYDSDFTTSSSSISSSISLGGGDFGGGGAGGSWGFILMKCRSFSVCIFLILYLLTFVF